MKPIHITAGLVALIAGAIALYATKGSPLHRRAGMVFAVAMLAMSSTGALMALFIKPNPVNVMAGALTFYLVATGVLAVKRTVGEMRGALAGLMAAAIALGTWAATMGLAAVASPRGFIEGVPAPPLFIFAFAGLGGALLDARMLRAGVIEGRHRIARHLWRMGLAMWIATTSFFLGQAKVFPDFLRQHIEIRAIPPLLVAGLVVYWLVRTLARRRRAKAPAMPALGAR
jgi:uncharacterized membrane protein